MSIIKDKIDKLVDTINCSIKELYALKNTYNRTLGYKMDVGSLLNAYREGDITFNRAKELIDSIKISEAIIINTCNTSDAQSEVSAIKGSFPTHVVTINGTPMSEFEEYNKRPKMSDSTSKPESIIPTVGNPKVNDTAFVCEKCGKVESLFRVTVVPPDSTYSTYINRFLIYKGFVVEGELFGGYKIQKETLCLECTENL